jgi:hypothetical protein
MRSRICLLGMCSEHLSISMWMRLRSKGAWCAFGSVARQTVVLSLLDAYRAPSLCRFHIRMGLPLQLALEPRYCRRYSSAPRHRLPVSRRRSYEDLEPSNPRRQRLGPTPPPRWRRSPCRPRVQSVGGRRWRGLTPHAGVLLGGVLCLQEELVDIDSQPLQL